MRSDSLSRTVRRIAERTRSRAREVLDRREWYQWRIACELRLRTAPLYRPLLFRTLFIGVTGSCGKSTTKELLGGILASSMKGSITPLTMNQPEHVARTILQTRPFDRYSVHEIGVGKAGQPHVVPLSLRLIRPRIGVVTNIGDDHLSAFGSREAIAREKGKLIEALPASGTAVLNADDPLVLAMGTRSKARVLTYGLSPGAMLRAEDIRATWPERLSFVARYGNESALVQTQLCGAHWVHAGLAAIGAALAAGIPLAAAARALQSIPPFEGRMSPHARDDGVTFLRDDGKAPVWTIPPALDFLAKAKAKRKIVIVGTLSDYTNDHRTAYVAAARKARAVADQVIFIGPYAWNVLRLRRHPTDAAVQAFNSRRTAHAYLDRALRAGDLVLLKGHYADFLETLMSPEVEDNVHGPLVDEAEVVPSESVVDNVPLVVVGLGNPGPEHVATRHNVGQALVDRLAVRLGAAWQTLEDASIAWTQWREFSLCLIKPRSVMNHTGPVLGRLYATLQLLPRRSILLHDEVHLEPGRVRARMEGGDGGHLGVRSILQTFEDNTFRRVKVGIGRPPTGQQLVEHVLAPFRTDEREIIERAMQLALDQVLLFLDEMAEQRRAPDSSAYANASAET